MTIVKQLAIRELEALSMSHVHPTNTNYPWCMRPSQPIPHIPSKKRKEPARAHMQNRDLYRCVAHGWTESTSIKDMDDGLDKALLLHPCIDLWLYTQSHCMRVTHANIMLLRARIPLHLARGSVETGPNGAVRRTA